MTDDAELLRRHAHEQDSAAFGELVQRHLNLVYRTAVRQLGHRAALAEDVAQVVFSTLARKAPALVRHTSIAGWLHTTTCFTVRTVLRAERQRQRREQEAVTMHDTLPEPNDEAWGRLRPVIDQEVRRLGAEDGEAVLLRFFEDRSFAAIGAVLRISEDAARMRVQRALERLRLRLERRGIASTGAALATALSTQAAWAAPTGLAATVTGAALAGSAVVSVTTATTAYFMGLTKLQIGIASALVIAGAGTLATGESANAAVRDQITVLQAENRQLSELRRENEQLQRATAEAARGRADAELLATLQTEAAGLRDQVRRAEQSPAPAPAARQLAPGTAQALNGLNQFVQQKRYAEAIPMLDALIAAAPAGSYDLAVLTDTKGRMLFAAQKFVESLPVMEQAAQLAEEKGYFTSRQLFELHTMVAALRFQQKLTTNVPTPWFRE